MRARQVGSSELGAATAEERRQSTAVVGGEVLVCVGGAAVRNERALGRMAVAWHAEEHRGIWRGAPATARALRYTLRGLACGARMAGVRWRAVQRRRRTVTSRTDTNKRVNTAVRIESRREMTRIDPKTRAERQAVAITPTAFS